MSKEVHPRYVMNSPALRRHIEDFHTVEDRRTAFEDPLKTHNRLHNGGDPFMVQHVHQSLPPTEIRE